MMKRMATMSEDLFSLKETEGGNRFDKRPLKLGVDLIIFIIVGIVIIDNFHDIIQKSL